MMTFGINYEVTSLIRAALSKLWGNKKLTLCLPKFKSNSKITKTIMNTSKMLIIIVDYI